MNFDPLESFIWYIAFLFSVTVHEAAHAWAAMRGGDLTAYFGGQVTLDPLPHIRREPLGMVILPLLSLYFMGWPFGYASAPYDPSWASRHPKKAAWMSVAGPASNFMIFLISAVLIKVGLVTGYFQVPDWDHFGLANIVDGTDPGFASNIAMAASIFMSLNLILALLNIMPLPPLDGSGILPAFMSHEGGLRYQRFMRQPMISLIGLIIVWNLFGIIFMPVLARVLMVLYSGS